LFLILWRYSVDWRHNSFTNIGVCRREGSADLENHKDEHIEYLLLTKLKIKDETKIIYFIYARVVRFRRSMGGRCDYIVD